MATEILTKKIDHSRRAALHSNAAELLRLNNILVDPGYGKTIIELAEERELLFIDPVVRASVGLPEKPTTEV